MKKLYQNPNISYYAKKNELNTERFVFHCAHIMRNYVRGHVLDLGAGQGHITDALTKDNENVTSVLCVDFSDYNKKFLLRKNYSFKKINLDKYPHALPSNAYDAVLSNDLVEHLLSPYLHFVESHRLLRKGGWFIISTPQASKTTVTVPHINYFSPEGLELSLKRAGFKKVIRIYNGVLSQKFTTLTNRIPVLRGILNNGCYFVAQK